MAQVQGIPISFFSSALALSALFSKLLAHGGRHLQRTPRYKTDTCRKNLEELIFAQIHVGPVFALSRIQENILEELFLKYVFAPLPPASVWI